MAFTIPDKGEGNNDIQSILFQEALDILVAGIDGVDCVLSGGAVTPNALLVLNVAKCAVLTNGVLKAVAAGTIAVAAVDITNPRIDYIVINSSGAIATRTGTAAAAPKPPNRTANDVVLAQVYVPANDVTIGAGQITDRRVLRTKGPILIDKVTTPVTFNTTSTIQTYYSLVIPSGLFLTGKILRLRCGGTMLLNSGSPTVTLTIAYGGTTMYADASAAATASSVRRPWWVQLSLTAQGNSDQQLLAETRVSNVTAATTGFGDIAAASLLIGNNLLSGSAAVDSDAADRTLTVQWTMSVSNVADEIVMEDAMTELL